MCILCIFVRFKLLYPYLIFVSPLSAPTTPDCPGQGSLSVQPFPRSSLFISLMRSSWEFFLVLSEGLRLRSGWWSWCSHLLFHSVGIVKPFETATVIKSYSNELEPTSHHCCCIIMIFFLTSMFKLILFSSRDRSREMESALRLWLFQVWERLKYCLVWSSY